MRIRGIVSRWTDRGFGWIKRDDGRADLFCHVSKIDGAGWPKNLTVGEAVEFDVGQDHLGRPCAIDVISLGTVPNHLEET